MMIFSALVTTGITMPKIKPIAHSDDSAFDGIDEVHNTDFHLHRGTKGKKRIKKKQTTRLDGYSSQPKDIGAFVQNLIVGKKSIYIGSPFFVMSLLLAMLLELIPKYQRYNAIIILTMAASVEFRMFPTKSVRAQMAVSLAAILSIAIDLFQVTTGSMPPIIIATIVFVGVFKVLLLNAFLRNSQGAVRTRKYLDRRFRLFILPMYEPRRIMRDVRGRMLAVGWLHLVASLFYFILFMLLVLYLDYSVFYLHPTSGAWLPTFLAFKTLSSLVILSGVLYDTDIRLCLWHFGCLGCYIEYVRKYIRRKRIELHGFPLVFSFGNRRFYMLSFVKVLDIGWGMYGWSLVGYSFGTHFMSLDTHLKIFYGLVAFCLVVFDLWVGVLLLGVRWLLRRKKVVRALGELLDSDDSEIEEFGLRTNLEEGIEYQKDKAALVEARRQMYYQRMKKEELRLVESTSTGRSSAAAAADWIQQFSPWVPSRTNAIHPGSGTEVDAADWEDGEVQTLGRAQTHPLLRQMQAHAEFNDASKASNKYEAFRMHAQDLEEKRKTLDQVEITEHVERISPRRSALLGPPTSTLVSKAFKHPQTPPPEASLAARQVVQDKLLKRTPVSYSSSDEDVPVRAPLKKHTSSEPFDYEDNPLRVRAASRLIARPSSEKTTTTIDLTASSKSSSAQITLVKALTLSPEQFAGVWAELADCSVISMSTVLVPGPALEDSGSDEEGGGNAQVTVTVRRMQQALLSQVAAHLRGRGFCLTSAGLHPQRVIKVLFYGTAEQRGQTAALPDNPALRMGLLEVTMFPGAAVPTSQGLQQSYLMETTCRSRNSQLGSALLGLLSFGNIFKLID